MRKNIMRDLRRNIKGLGVDRALLNLELLISVHNMVLVSFKGYPKEQRWYIGTNKGIFTLYGNNKIIDTVSFVEA